MYRLQQLQLTCLNKKQNKSRYTMLFVMIQCGILQRIATCLKKKSNDRQQYTYFPGSTKIVGLDQPFVLHVYTEFKRIILSSCIGTNYSDMVDMLWTTIQLVITLMTLNFLRRGKYRKLQLVFSQRISNAIQQPLATKMKLKKSDLNFKSYMYLNHFLIC